MASKKFGLKFDGVAELSEQIDKLGGDLKKTTEAALAFIPGEVTPKLRAAMAKHTRYGQGTAGKTAQSLVEGQQVQWNGSVASIAVGFDLKKGGMPSIFLMYGTPRHAPRNQYGGATREGAEEHPGYKADRELYDAIYGKRIQAEIAKRQREIFEEVLEKVLK